MGLTGKAKKDYQRDYMKRKRSNKTDGSNKGLTKGVTSEEVIDASGKGLPWYDRAGKPVMDASYPDIIDKLTDKVWRTKLEKLSAAFQASSNPSYAKDVRLGKIPLDVVFNLLECTR